ncbi:hypothetical protein Tco_0294255 [Tanacetum coccineum]
MRPHLLPILYHYHQALTDTLTLPDHIAPSLGIPPPLAISVPTSSPPSSLLPSASHREDRPEVTLPPRKRLGIALGPGYEVGESSSAAAARPAGGLRVDYGFVATMDREIRRDPEREVGMGINRLMGRDFETPMQFMSLRTTVLGQMSEIRELHAADRRRQAVTSEMLKVDHRRSKKMRELRTSDRTRQQHAYNDIDIEASLLQREDSDYWDGDHLARHVNALQG